MQRFIPWAVFSVGVVVVLISAVAPGARSSEVVFACAFASLDGPDLAYAVTNSRQVYALEGPGSTWSLRGSVPADGSAIGITSREARLVVTLDDGARWASSDQGVHWTPATASTPDE